MTAKIARSCEATDWRTPVAVLEAVRDYAGGGEIALDPCGTPDNHTKARFAICEPVDPIPAGGGVFGDGLTVNWFQLVNVMSIGPRERKVVYVNPPYGKVLPLWLKKIHDEADQGTEIIALVSTSDRITTKYWARDVWPNLDAMCIVTGRLAFLDHDGVPVKGNTHGSFILGYNVDITRFRDAFSKFGLVACDLYIDPGVVG